MAMPYIEIKKIHVMIRHLRMTCVCACVVPILSVKFKCENYLLLTVCHMPVHVQGTKIGECTVYSTNFLRSFYPTILFILFFIYPIISSSNYYHNCPSLLFSVNSGSSRSQTQILNCFLFIFFFFYNDLYVLFIFVVFL